ncbi:MAG: T9SS type A sorting domain-containing protein [Bacteroidetes bacterium]|nr:T9SS type A sorting domain-containing protein [Bacteroidota bacterium]
MKTNLFFLLFLLLLTMPPIRAQEYRGAEIDLQVSNGADRSAYLFLGVREGCTNGLDMEYEEYELPPVPPNEIFDVRIVSTPGHSQLGLGSYRDYRPEPDDDEIVTLQYTISWQCGEGSDHVVVEWSDPLPARIVGLVIDGDDMQGNTSWVSPFPQGQATVEVRFRYRPLSFVATPASIHFDANNIEPLPYLDLQIQTEGDHSAAWILQYDVPWLYVNPSSGNGEASVRVSVVSASLPLGTQSTTLRLRSPVYDAWLDIPVELSMTVGVVSPPSPTQPYLYQSYPNPFSGQTVLHFQLGSITNAAATLQIFDDAGRMVADLSDAVRPVETMQTVLFDAADLPPGLYVCRLFYREMSFTTGMMLLK